MLRRIPGYHKIEVGNLGCYIIINCGIYTGHLVVITVKSRKPKWEHEYMQKKLDRKMHFTSATIYIVDFKTVVQPEQKKSA